MRPVLFLFCLCAFACGGDVRNRVVFWQLTSSTLEYGACSDEPRFREGSTPFPVDDNTFLIYRLAEDGQTAKAQTCSRVDATTCSELDGGAVWMVAGNELTFATSFSQPITNADCVVDQTQTWRVTDAQSTMTLDIDTVLTLRDLGTGDAGTCAQVEASQRAASPNGLGVEGCVVTAHLAGERR